jgi:DNA-binding NarL/FixJ family response regulator
MHIFQKNKIIMSLTERERLILELAGKGLSDYKIARKINTDPPSVTRSRKNAQKKLREARIDLEWAEKVGSSSQTRC